MRSIVFVVFGALFAVAAGCVLLVLLAIFASAGVTIRAAHPELD